LLDIIDYIKTANYVPSAYDTDPKSLQSLIQINGDLISQMTTYLRRIEKIP
jgi:hypothetical protein